MVIEAQFKVISAMKNIHLWPCRAGRCRQKCTLFNGIDQGLVSSRVRSHYGRLIHGFLGNDAHRAITQNAILCNAKEEKTHQEDVAESNALSFFAAMEVSHRYMSKVHL